VVVYCGRSLLLGWLVDGLWQWFVGSSPCEAAVVFTKEKGHKICLGQISR